MFRYNNFYLELNATWFYLRLYSTALRTFSHLPIGISSSSTSGLSYSAYVSLTTKSVSEVGSVFAICFVSKNQYKKVLSTCWFCTPVTSYFSSRLSTLMKLPEQKIKKGTLLDKDIRFT